MYGFGGGFNFGDEKKEHETRKSTILKTEKGLLQLKREPYNEIFPKLYARVLIFLFIYLKYLFVYSSILMNDCSNVDR